MAKKKVNKNRSYREMERHLKAQEALIEKKRREELESGMNVIMIGFSMLAILLIVISALKVVDQVPSFILAIAEIILAFCCLIGYIKEPDKSIKKMGIVMSVCAGVSIVAALIC